MCNKSINEDLELNINFKYIYLPKEEVIYLFPDECPQSKEFTIYSMQDSLQKVPLPENVRQ